MCLCHDIRSIAHLLEVRLAVVVPGLEASEFGKGFQVLVQSRQVLLLRRDVLERLESARIHDDVRQTHLVGGEDLRLVGHGCC